SLACSLDNPLEFLAEGWIVGSSCAFLHQCLHREPRSQLQELRNRGRRLCLLPPPGVRRGEIDVGEVIRLTGRKRLETPLDGLSEPASGLTILRIDSKSILEQPDGPLHILLIRPSIQDGPATHGEVHRIWIAARRPAAFNIDEFNTEHPCKSVRDAEVVLGS